MESAGAKLKKIRLEKGLSLEEVQKKTKIHLNILKAIEGDSFTNINPVYLKGFLKIYCKFLGLAPKDYIADYKEIVQTPDINVIATGGLDKPKKVLSLLKTVTVKFTSLRAPSKKVKAIFISLLIIIFLTWGLFNLGKYVSSRRTSHLASERLSRSASDKKEIKKKQITQKAEVITVSPKQPSLTQTKPLKEASSGIRLIIKARQNCWVHLEVDGRVVFQRVLEKGRSETWQAKDRIKLSLGNAGVVELQVNDRLFSNLGRRGQVRKNIIITKEGLNIGR